MKRETPKTPTDSELEILRVLWEHGPSTVKEVHETLSAAKSAIPSATKPVGYTTILKLLQIMTVKGTVTRNERDRAHVYVACQPAERTKRQMAGEIMEKVFGGSASELVLHALSGQKASHEEIEEIRRMLDEYERKLP
jgi:predicted transcriptional regulator